MTADDMTDAQKVAAWDRLTELVAEAERMVADVQSIDAGTECPPVVQRKRTSKTADSNS